MIIKSLRPSLWFSRVLVCALVVFALGLSGSAQRKSVEQGEAAQKWRGVHLLNYNNDADLERLAGRFPEVGEEGSKLLNPEGDYHLQIPTHPGPSPRPKQ